MSTYILFIYFLKTFPLYLTFYLRCNFYIDLLTNSRVKCCHQRALCVGLITQEPTQMIGVRPSISYHNVTFLISVVEDSFR